jgi:hypothetical protein
MSMQILWDLKYKNNTKNTYYFYMNDMFFELVMYWYDLHMIYILTKFVQLSLCNFGLKMRFLSIKHEHSSMSFFFKSKFLIFKKLNTCKYYSY